MNAALCLDAKTSLDVFPTSHLKAKVGTWHLLSRMKSKVSEQVDEGIQGLTFIP